MTNKVDETALRSLLILAALAAAVFGIRVLLLHREETGGRLTSAWSAMTAPSTPVSASGMVPAPPSRPFSQQGSLFVHEPSRASAIPVESFLAGNPQGGAGPEDPAGSHSPKRFVVTAPPKVWSRLVEVPPGGGSFTFSLGRIRIERNGVDVGMVYRKPSLEAHRVDDQIVVGKVDFGAFFDKTPRTLSIDAGTKTLRFSSVERVAGVIEIRFAD